MEKYLDEKLEAYSRSDVYPFHMPGHKRRHLGDWTPEEIDITEIDGFDNLHHAEGILRDAQRRLAKLCGADESFYLVNGSTCGLLAAICGATKKGDRILMARNCHKAVYHAVYLMELKAEYIYPESTELGIQGSINPAKVRAELEELPDVAAVVITSPTYDGVVSDIAEIARAAHAHGVPLIVDEAHGAHFGFSQGFPQKAIALGADLCIESFHKTLPAFTQTAVLHAMRTDGGAYRFAMDAVRRYLGIFQTSSPSYMLMAGLDRCVRLLEEDRRQYESEKKRNVRLEDNMGICDEGNMGEVMSTDSLFGKFEGRLRRFYEACAGLKRVCVFAFGISASLSVTGEKESSVGENADKPEMMKGVWARDCSKILISATALGWSGQRLCDVLLKKYHMQMEMASGHYVTALTSIMDTDEGFARLLAALKEIDCAIGDSRAGDSLVNSCERDCLDVGGNKGEKDFPKEKSGAICDREERNIVTPLELYCPQEKALELAAAMNAPKKTCRLAEAAGRISGEFIYLYPPGIPIIAPGELLTEATVRTILHCQKQGLQVQGLADMSAETVQCVS